MNYTPKHSDKAVRALYLGLFLLGVITMLLKGEGTVGIAFICISIVSLISSIYFVVRYELTTYSYIVNENNGRNEFAVNKAVGKRGNYVCYYMVSDIVKIEDYSSETREALKKDYPNTFFYNYTHTLFEKKKQVILFKNSAHYDAVIVELNDECYGYMKNIIELEKSKRQASPFYGFDEDATINVSDEEKSDQ